MKSIFQFIFLFLLIPSLFSQTKTINLSDYTIISVSEGIEVNLHEGDSKAECEMLKGDIDDLLVEQSGKKVKVHFKSSGLKFWGNNNRRARVDLYYNSSLSEIKVSSGASVEGHTTLISDDLEVDVSSGARVELELESSDVDVDISSGASASLEGETKRLKVDASSGASFNGKDLKSKYADADASSGASVKIWVTDDLKANASSGGSVKFKGDPKSKDIDSNKWSGGSVREM